MRFLGVDYGRRRIGLALGEKGMVRPLTVMRKDSSLWEKLARLCQEENIDRIVLGWCEDLQPDIGEFFSHLSRICPVIKVDETLTTKKGVDKMIQEGMSRKKRQKEKDVFAAMAILEDFFQGGENV